MQRRDAEGRVDETIEDPFVGLLANRLAEQGRAPGTPVTVAALCKTLLPYAACREALGVASKGEYDVALLRFMHTGGALTLDEELAKAIERELANPEPGLAFLRHFAAAKVTVRLGHEGLEREVADLEREISSDRERDVSGDLDELLSEPSGEEADTSERDTSEEVSDEPLVEPPQPLTPGTSEVPVRCSKCEEALPEDREVRFCPFCGHDQRVRLCAECDEELIAEWRFCPRCGTAA